MQFTEIVLFSFSLQVIAETFLCLCGLRHNYIAQNDELWVSMIQRVKLTFNQTANSSLTVDEIKTCLRNESWDVWRAGRGGKWVFVSIKLFGMKRSMRLESETIHVKTSASFSPRFSTFHDPRLTVLVLIKRRESKCKESSLRIHIED